MFHNLSKETKTIEYNRKETSNETKKAYKDIK